MVMNTPAEVEQALADYNAGMFGVPWDHSLDDPAWQEEVRKMAARMGRSY